MTPASAAIMSVAKAHIRKMPSAALENRLSSFTAVMGMHRNAVCVGDLIAYQRHRGRLLSAWKDIGKEGTTLDFADHATKPLVVLVAGESRIPLDE